MPDDFNLSVLHDADASLTLCVGWRSGAKLKLGQLTVGPDVANELRRIVSDVATDLETRERAPWAPDADLTVETVLEIGQEELGKAPVLAGEQAELTLAQSLLAAEGLPILYPNELPAGDMVLYAITVGSQPGERIALLRRVNPRRGLRGGKFLTSYSDVLSRIDAPVFAFDEYVDVVFVGVRALILSQTAFVALFRSQENLMAQVPRWATDLGAHISITVAGLERLTAKAIRDSRMRTRLEAIARRGHLADVEPAAVRAKMTELGLDPSRLLDADGKLILDDDDIPVVLQFLNEDLFSGALTGLGFRADKKATRS